MQFGGPCNMVHNLLQGLVGDWFMVAWTYTDHTTCCHGCHSKQMHKQRMAMHRS